MNTITAHRVQYFAQQNQSPKTGFGNLRLLVCTIQTSNHAAQTEVSALPQRGFLLMLFVMLFAGSIPAHAQQSPELRIESVRGAFGAKVRLPVRILNASDIQGNITLEGRIVLSNSSMFFPETWTMPQGAQNLASSLARVNDSTYLFSVNTRRSAAPHDTIAYLQGEILAGSDTVMNVHFRSLILRDARGSRTIANASGEVRLNTLDVNVPFVRFSQLSINAPNPVLRGSATRWAYTIDVPSEVVFTIYNLSGELVERIERQQGRGSHVETWMPRPNLAAGAYFVRFTTNSGDVVQRLLIE
jgi:hypothetical protein